MKNKLIVIFLLSVLLTCFTTYQFASTKNKKYEVKGKVEKLANSQSENFLSIKKSIPFDKATVLIIPGKVRHISHSNFIKISKIESSKMYIHSDQFGDFKVKLNPGEYTFFLVIDDMAYLNSFDRSGNFTSTLVDSKVDDLIITDFRDVSF